MRRLAKTLLILFSAAWLPAQEVRVNTFTGGPVHWAGSVVTVGGDFLVAWGIYNWFCGSTSAYRRMDSRGGFAAPEVMIWSACTAHSEEPKGAMLPSGAFAYVGAIKDGDQGVGIRLFDPTGTPLGPDIIVNQQKKKFQGDAEVAAIGNDRYAVVWWDNHKVRIVGRIVMADGTMPDPEVVIAASQGNIVPFGQRVARAGGANVVVGWSASSTTYGSAQMRIYDGTFTPLGPEVIVDGGNAPNFAWVEDIAGGAFGYALRWRSTRGSTTAVGAARLQLFDPQGNAISPDVLAKNDPNMGGTALAADDAGNSVFVWKTYDPATLHDVMAQRFDAMGNKVGPEWRVNSTAANEQLWPVVGMDPAGNFVVAWSSEQQPWPYHDSLIATRYFFPRSLLLGAGPGYGNPAEMEVKTPDGVGGGPLLKPFAANRYGTNVGAGDIDGVGLDELLAGPGPGPVLGPQVRGFGAGGKAIQKVNFFAYGSLRYGVRPTVGEIDGDGYGEIVTGAGAGSLFGPHVRAFDYDGVKVVSNSRVSYYAYETLRYGVRVAVGEIDGDGYGEVLTGPGPGAIFGPHIRGFDYDGSAVKGIGKVSFMAFPTGSYGASVSAGDIESDGVGGYRDGYDEIVVGPGPDPRAYAEVVVFDYDGGSVVPTVNYRQYNSRYGENVAGGDADRGDSDEVAVAPGPDPSVAAEVKVYDVDPGVDGGFRGLSVLGPDDFTWRAYIQGANLVIGTFE